MRLVRRGRTGSQDLPALQAETRAQRPWRLQEASRQGPSGCFHPDRAPYLPAAAGSPLSRGGREGAGEASLQRRPPSARTPTAPCLPGFPRGGRSLSVCQVGST